MIISTTLSAFSAGLFWSESGNLKVLDGSPMNSGCFFSLCLELLMCRQEKRNVFLIYCWSSIVSQQKTFGLLYLRLSLKKASKATMFLSRSWSLKKAFFRLHMTRVFPCFWKAFQELFSIELKGFSPPDILLFQRSFSKAFDEVFGRFFRGFFPCPNGSGCALLTGSGGSPNRDTDGSMRGFLTYLFRGFFPCWFDWLISWFWGVKNHPFYFPIASCK